MPCQRAASRQLKGCVSVHLGVALIEKLTASQLLGTCLTVFSHHAGVRDRIAFLQMPRLPEYLSQVGQWSAFCLMAEPHLEGG